MVEKLSDFRKGSKCGCTLKKEGNAWILDEYCDSHKPNYSKKAGKMMRKIERHDRRKMFLEFRARKRKHENRASI